MKGTLNKKGNTPLNNSKKLTDNEPGANLPSINSDSLTPDDRKRPPEERFERVNETPVQDFRNNNPLFLCLIHFCEGIPGEFMPIDMNSRNDQLSRYEALQQKQGRVFQNSKLPTIKRARHHLISENARKQKEIEEKIGLIIINSKPGSKIYCEAFAYRSICFSG